MASVALMWFPLPGAGLPAPLRVTYGLLASESRCLSRKHVSRFRDKSVTMPPCLATSALPPRVIRACDNLLYKELFQGRADARQAAGRSGLDKGTLAAA